MKACQVMNYLVLLKRQKINIKTRIEKIREKIKKLQHKFSRQEIKEIEKNLYEVENKKGLSASKKTKNYQVILCNDY